MDRLMAIYTEARLEQVARAYCMADRDERKARLRTDALSVELERVRAQTIFGTGLAEASSSTSSRAIGGPRSTGCTSPSRTRGEPVTSRYAPVYEKFVEVIRVESALAEKRAKGETGRPD